MKIAQAIARVPVATSDPIPSIRTLKKLATGKGIPGYSNMTKTQLAQALRDLGVL